MLFVLIYRDPSSDRESEASLIGIFNNKEKALKIYNSFNNYNDEYILVEYDNDINSFTPEWEYLYFQFPKEE